jgi:glutathione S-transferase
MRMYTLTIGDKAYSSWSLRGWLLLAAFDLPFEEELVRMYDPQIDAMQAARDPVRSLPQLSWEVDGRPIRIWDSLAIAETLAERHPQAGLWPTNANNRAAARTLAADMHSGLTALRGACPMNLHRQGRPHANPPEALEGDLRRLARLWAWALEQTGGPWLGGPAFSAVDVFFAPVATRLDSYALIRPETEAYATRLLAHPAVRRWYAEAQADPRRIAHYEEGR